MNLPSAFLALLLLGATGSAWGQVGSTLQDKDIQNRGRGDFDRLSGKQSKLLNEARKQIHLKHYAEAEKLCRDGIDLMSPAPFAQAPAKQELAQVYLAEENYKEALALWKPMFVPQDPLKELCFGMAVAYARLNEAEKGAEVLRILYKDDPIDFKFLSGGDAPMDDEITPETVEATTILMRVHVQPSYLDDDEADMKRAVSLAPHNGPALWQLADFYYHQPNGGLAKAKPYYIRAYHYGNKLIKDYCARTINNGEPLPDQP